MKSFLHKQQGILLIALGFLFACISVIADQLQHPGIHRLVLPVVASPLVMLAYERFIAWIYQQTTTDRVFKPYPLRLMLLIVALIECEYLVIAGLLYLNGVKW